uniref:Coagulation factor XIII B chain n=1 Tax=Junco hyemalis TaxID=40217 RepID=A0A8C5JQ50_JUNHY
FYSRHWQVCAAKDTPCDLPQIENGNLPQYYYSFKSYYFPMHKGKKLSYSCVVGYTTESGTQDGRITCTAKGWSPVPRCYSELALFIIASSRDQYCYKPLLLLAGKKYIPFFLSNQAVFFPSGKCTKPVLENGSFYSTEMDFKIHEKLQYKCNPGYLTPSGAAEDTVQCQPQGWSSQPSSATEKCGSPPSVANGALTVPALPQYESGSSVQYICSEYHFLQGSERIYCSEGQWTSPPVCIEPCTLSKTEMEKNNVLLQAFYADQVYFYHGDYVGFYCKQNHFGAESGTTLFQVQCERGQLAYPRCVEREKQVWT